MSAPVTRGAFVHKLPPIEEELADAAFLSLAKLRDKLVARDLNIAACRVDEAIDALQAACKEFVR